MDHHTPNPSMTPRDLLSLLHRRRALWIVPTVLCTALALVYALFMSPKWEATQSLIARQEAAGTQLRPGMFSNLSEMKSLQETILEIAKSRSVLAGTLEKVGPPPSLLGHSNWPTDQDIADFRRSVRMTPPGGAEFGKTEVFYLSVRSANRDRALKLVSELYNQLDRRFQEVRDLRAQSMIRELEKTVSLAEADLQQATTELTAFETAVGADLPELRILQLSPSGSSDLRQKLVTIENNKQQYEAKLRQDRQLMEVLKAAREDATHLVATPNSLLASQPALRRLKDGLVDAQLRLSRLMGLRSLDHPEVIAAQFARQEVRESLHREIETAIRGLQVDLEISEDRLAAVEEQLAQGRARLERLAELRARYDNLIALKANRTKLSEAARKTLADARASSASALASSLIVRIDNPDTGVNPVGPGRATVVAAGMVGGLVVGLGLVFLAGGPASSPDGAGQSHGSQSAQALQQSAAPLPSTALLKATPPVPVPEPLPSDSYESEPVTQFAEPAAVATAAAAPSGQTFGMYEGKTLRQAIAEVRHRDQQS